MTDLERAKTNLKDHSLCLVKGTSVIFSDKHGIAPLMDLIEEGTDLAGYSAADKVVGKAAALLFVKCGVIAVFAGTLSESAKEIFKAHKIAFEAETTAARILNRAGDDICPMEKAVCSVDGVEEGYFALKERLKRLREEARGA